MTKYCLGFAFDPSGLDVLLIRKNRPTWMMGKLSGIGGHIEEGEAFDVAQAREFFEETGIKTGPYEWTHFATLSNQSFEMQVFSAYTDAIYRAVSKTDEVVGVLPVASVYEARQIISDVPWLVAAALEKYTERNDLMIEAHY